MPGSGRPAGRLGNRLYPVGRKETNHSQGRAPGLLPASALLALLWPGVAAAHVIPLDVTVSRAGALLQARVLSPDGQTVRGVKLYYQLAAGSPQPFRETVPGVYSAPVGALARPGKVTILDRTFPREGSQASAVVAWPPVQPLILRLPAARPAGVPPGFTPALVAALLLTLGFAGLCWRALRTAGRRPEPG